VSIYTCVFLFKNPSNIFAACCGALRCVAVCCGVLRCVAVCCSVLRCVVVCCGALRCVAAYIYTERPGETFSGTNLFNDSPNVDHVPVYALRYAENVSKSCSVLQCVAVLQGSYSSIYAA